MGGGLTIQFRLPIYTGFGIFIRISPIQDALNKPLDVESNKPQESNHTQSFFSRFFFCLQKMSDGFVEIISVGLWLIKHCANLWHLYFHFCGISI